MGNRRKHLCEQRRGWAKRTGGMQVRRRRGDTQQYWINRKAVSEIIHLIINGPLKINSICELSKRVNKIKLTSKVN